MSKLIGYWNRYWHCLFRFHRMAYDIFLDGYEVMHCGDCDKEFWNSEGRPLNEE